MTDDAPAGLDLLNWDQGGPRSAWAYLHLDRVVPTVEIPTAAAPAPLRAAERPRLTGLPVDVAGTTLAAYVDSAPVDGIVVLHRGRVAFERYPRMRPTDRHLLMSVTKAVTSTLLGILEDRGLVDADAPVEAHVPALAGTAWAGIRLADVLDMASGIDCPEDSLAAYTDPDAPFFRFEATLGWRPPFATPMPTAYDHVAALPRLRPPGGRFAYTGVNTFVLSWVIEAVTGSSYAAVLERELWSRVGFEAPALLAVGPGGAPGSHGGLATVRDLARFGLLFTPSAALVGGDGLVDTAHLRRIRRSGRPELHRRPAPGSGSPARIAAYGDSLPPAGRQWGFLAPDGDLFKSGYGGQGLHVSPARDVVVAFVGTQRADGTDNELRWIGRTIATRVEEWAG